MHLFILLDFKIQINHQLTARMQHLMIEKKKENMANRGLSWQSENQRKREETQILELARELEKKKTNMEVTVIVICAHGKIHKRLIRWQDCLVVKFSRHIVGLQSISYFHIHIYICIFLVDSQTNKIIKDFLPWKPYVTKKFIVKKKSYIYF